MVRCLMADHGLQNARRSSFGYILSQLVQAAIGFITIPVFARVLGPAEFGLYVTIIATTGILSVLGGQWLNGAAQRFYLEYSRDGRLDGFFSTLVFALATSLGALTALVLVGVVYADVLRILISPVTLLWSAALAVSFSAYQFLLIVLYVDGDGVRYLRVSTIYSVGKSVLGIALCVLGLHLNGILLGWLLTLIGVSGYLVRHLRLKERVGVSRFDRKSLSNFLRYGIPLIGIALAWNMLAIGDRYLIGFFASASEVGTYSAVYSLAEQSVGLAFSLVTFAGYPTAVRDLVKKGSDHAREGIVKLFRASIMLALPPLVFLSIFERELVEMIFGGDYVTTGLMLPIACGSFFFGIARYYGMGLEFGLKTRTSFLIWMAAAVLNLGLNLAWIPLAGVRGAGWATFFGYLMLLVTFMVVGSHHFPIRIPLPSLLRIAGSAALMLVVCYAVRAVGLPPLPSFALSVISGGAVYAGALIATREFPSELLLAFSRAPRAAAATSGDE